MYPNGASLIPSGVNSKLPECYDSVLDSLSQLRVSRRAFLAAAAAFTACSRKRAPRYRGWLFVASAAEKAVVVADLSTFRRSGSIALGAAPDQVLSVRGKLFAVCGANQTVLQIDPIQRTITGRIALSGYFFTATVTTE